MKLLADVNNTHAVFSVSHYDYRSTTGLCADGGQPGLQNYAGYGRYTKEPVWIELPNVTFADLVNDYQFNTRNRQYGIHPIGEVRILDKSEIPNTDSFEWQVENACWGTNGPKGDRPTKYVLLKDCESDHLKAIIANCPHARGMTFHIIERILQQRQQLLESADKVQ